MKGKDIEKIIEKSDFIVAGYAFTKRDDGLISIVALDAPNHAAIIDSDGNLLETNMYDIEIGIVLNRYWANNKKQILD